MTTRPWTCVVATALVFVGMSAFAVTDVDIERLREVASRFGMTPAESRAFMERQNAAESLIIQLAQQNQVHEKAMRAIAAELGARNQQISSERFVRLIRDGAEDAAKAKASLLDLRATLVKLDPGGEMSLAIELAARAQRAFDDGRLREAEESYKKLSTIRWGQTANAQVAWIKTMNVWADSAKSRGDPQTADRVLTALSAAIEVTTVELSWHRWSADLKNARNWCDNGERLGRNADLLLCISYYKSRVLPLVPRESHPESWALVQSDLGIAMRILGERESDISILHEAVRAFNLALEEFTRERGPARWARTLNNLATVFVAIGQRNQDADAMGSAIIAYNNALQESELLPKLDIAMIYGNVGNALAVIGQQRRSAEALEGAARYYRLAMRIYSREIYPFEWASSQSNLSKALRDLGELVGDEVTMQKAIEAANAALGVFTPDREPLFWATAQSNLGDALYILGKQRADIFLLRDSAIAYTSALRERRKDRSSSAWAETHNNMANAKFAIGVLEIGTESLEEATRSYDAALEFFTAERMPTLYASITRSRAAALGLIQHRRDGSKHQN